jgi:hypothetical protein
MDLDLDKSIDKSSLGGAAPGGAPTPSNSAPDASSSASAAVAKAAVPKEPVDNNDDADAVVEGEQFAQVTTCVSSLIGAPFSSSLAAQHFQFSPPHPAPRTVPAVTLTIALSNPFRDFRIRRRCAPRLLLAA